VVIEVLDVVVLGVLNIEVTELAVLSVAVVGTVTERSGRMFVVVLASVVGIRLSADTCVLLVEVANSDGHHSGTLTNNAQNIRIKTMPNTTLLRIKSMSPLKN